MQLKKRMFRTNMKIITAVLVLLMVVLVGVLVLFEDAFESRLLDLSQTRLDGHLQEVTEQIQQTDSTEALSLQVRSFGYECALISDGEIIEGSTSEAMRELAHYYDDSSASDQEVFVSTFQRSTVVSRFIESENAVLVAVKFGDSHWIPDSVQPYFSRLILLLLVIGGICILLLLAIASFFTRRTNKIITEPLDLLTQGANRVKNGDLSQPVPYTGDAEFENLCRTFNDMQETIRKDKELRQKTEKARIDMITGISHDLRTPLTSVQGYIKGVLDGIADTEEKRNHYLYTAYRSTITINRLLQNLFDSSKMESGQLVLHKERLDCRTVLAEYIAQKKAMENTPAIRFTDLSKNPVILADRDQLDRILDNLLDNSVQHAHADPLMIDITLEETNNHIAIRWKDNGQGVPDEKLEHLFEQFYQADEARTKQGNGIGLYVVRVLMEMHNGKAAVRNNNGLQIDLIFTKEEQEHGLHPDC